MTPEQGGEGQSEDAAQADNRTLGDEKTVENAHRFLDQCVADGRVAVSGKGGYSLTFGVAQDLFGFGISQHLATEMMEDIWNPSCIPPWGPDDLAAIVAKAAVYQKPEEVNEQRFDDLSTAEQSELARQDPFSMLADILDRVKEIETGVDWLRRRFG